MYLIHRILRKTRDNFGRKYQDRYSDPGDFVTRRNEFGSYVLALDGNNAFLIGDGYSEEGQFPFIDKINLKTEKRKGYINLNIPTS